MPRVEVMNDVPNERVAEVKASFEGEGASVEVRPQPGGVASTLVATFPDPPPAPTAPMDTKGN